MKSIRPGEISYARSGDKGSSANIFVFASDDRQYDWLRQRLNEKVVEDFCAPLGVKNCDALRSSKSLRDQFRFRRSFLAEGGSRSLRIDAQGKTLGQAILEMELPA